MTQIEIVYTWHNAKLTLKDKDEMFEITLSHKFSDLLSATLKQLSDLYSKGENGATQVMRVSIEESNDE